MLYAIEQRFGNFATTFDVVPGNLRNGLVHCQVVLARGDNQIHFLNDAIPVDLIVME